MTQPEIKTSTCPICDTVTTKETADFMGFCLANCAGKYWMDPAGGIHPEGVEDYDPASMYE